MNLSIRRMSLRCNSRKNSVFKIKKREKKKKNLNDGYFLQIRKREDKLIKKRFSLRPSIPQNISKDFFCKILRIQKNQRKIVVHFIRRFDWVCEIRKPPCLIQIEVRLNWNQSHFQITWDFQKRRQKIKSGRDGVLLY